MLPSRGAVFQPSAHRCGGVAPLVATGIFAGVDTTFAITAYYIVLALAALLALSLSGTPANSACSVSPIRNISYESVSLRKSARRFAAVSSDVPMLRTFDA
jgi:hypothetical protein